MIETRQKRGWAHGGVGVLVLTATVLAWRRLAGGLHAPESPGFFLFLMGVGTAVIVAGSRILGSGRPRTIPSTPHDRLLASLVTAGLAIFALAISLPGDWPPALVLLWAPLVVEECWAWGLIAVLVRRGGSGQRLPARPSGSRPGLPPHSLPQALGQDPEEPPGDEVLQQLVRTRSADGGEILAGWLRVPLAAGQRGTSVHLAFCPPFPRTPEVEVVQCDGPAARIKTVQVLPYGARFDLGFAKPSEEGESVLLQVAAGVEGAVGA